MTDRPSFTVVIPSYNRAHLLEVAVQSVLAQDHGAIEIVIVDDASTDHTASVVASLTADPRVRALRHDANRERGAARNTGLDVASGDYVTFLDSDDRMGPSCLADARAYALAHPERPCFHNLFEVVNVDGQVVRRFPMPSLRDHRRAIAGGNFLACIGVFLRRDVYRAHRFDEDRLLAGSEDWDYFLRVLAGNALGRIEAVNSVMLDHPGRSMNNLELDRTEERIDRIVQRALEQEPLASAYRPYARFMRASSRVFLASGANDAGARSRARSYLLEAAVTYPRIVTHRRFLRSLQLSVRRAEGSA